MEKPCKQEFQLEKNTKHPRFRRRRKFKTKSPELCTPNLETEDPSYCKNLDEIHKSDEFLHKPNTWNLEGGIRLLNLRSQEALESVEKEFQSENMKNHRFRGRKFIAKSPELCIPNLETEDSSICKNGTLRLRSQEDFESSEEEFQLENLKHLSFRGCKFITKLSDLCTSNLVALDLSYCEDLVKIHGSSEFLRKLKTWMLEGCRNLCVSPRSETNDMSSWSILESLFPAEVEGNDMSSKSRMINLKRVPPLPERRGAEHGSFTPRHLLRTPRKRCEIIDYYKKQERQLKEYAEMEIMLETGRAPGNPAEDEMKQPERMAILVTNIASIVLFALKIFASILSKSFSITASILDPFFDLLWGFILWLTSRAMQNPNPHTYPIGKNRMLPVGMIIFGSFGLQLLFQAAKQFITKSEPEKDPQKEKWMIGVMTFVTMVQFMLAFYCRRYKNKIVRAYAEHHSSNVITNLISLVAAVLAIRYYWWIDPTGAIIILLYTMNTWKKTFFENLSALTGRTAPPEFLAKLTYLILKHRDTKKIGKVIAYASSSDHFTVEVDIIFPQDMVSSKTHDIREKLQEKVEQLPEVERAIVRIDIERTHRPEHKKMV